MIRARNLAETRHHRRILLLAIALLSGLPAGCGYQFSGSALQSDARWNNSTLQIIGPGAEAQPQLAYLLRDHLQARLGLQGAATGQEKGKLLKIVLERVERVLITEDRAGRANRYRVTIHAKPIVEGETGAPTFPRLQGTSTYYEPYISTSVQATQKRAETEAMEQLADTLVALLSSRFQPTP
ncbi:MAG: LPS assembly lipoprotein LptE [Magnetococcus sp. XQGC-1]